jgi:hypothetical protein
MVVTATAVRISATVAPALGDIRALGPGDWISLAEGATARKDWPRYADAILVAVTRGADVRWVR